MEIDELARRKRIAFLVQRLHDGLLEQISVRFASFDRNAERKLTAPLGKFLG